MVKRQTTKLSPSPDFFMPEEEGQICAALGQLLTESPDPEPYDAAKPLRESLTMDAANMFGVAPRTIRAAKVLCRYRDAADKDRRQKVPVLDFKTIWGIGGSTFSGTYLKHIIALLSLHDQTPSLRTGRNYVLKAANADFCVFLAPRPNNDDEDKTDTPELELIPATVPQTEEVTQ